MVTFVEERLVDTAVPVLVARKIKKRQLACKIGFIQAKLVADPAARAFLVGGLFTVDIEACEYFNDKANVELEGVLKMDYVGRADSTVFK